MIDQSNPTLFSGTPSDIWFHYPDSHDVRIAEITSGLEAKSGFPERIWELNDVFVVPGSSNMCLYDNTGHRIIESCLRRGKNRNEIVRADNEWVDLPDDYVDVRSPLLYLGVYSSHWGHFLTESINRLWARYANPELQKLDAFFAGFSDTFKRQPNASKFLNANSGDYLNVISLAGAAKIRKCFVPEPSFTHKFSAYTAHLNYPHRIAECIVGHCSLQTTSQPLYLSRSKLNDGTKEISNERSIEELLFHRGIKIVHPQELSIEQQIILFNEHTTIIGCWGSAFHNSVFTLTGKNVTTHLLVEQLSRDYLSNYALMDAIVGNSSHYAQLLQYVEMAREPQRPVWQIDIDLAFKYFRNAGIV